jgi:hypothetical protein
MTEDAALKFAKLHLEAWLATTPFKNLQDILNAQSVELHGRQVVETENMFGAISGIDRQMVESLVKENYQDYVWAADDFCAAFEDAEESWLADGTFIRE